VLVVHDVNVLSVDDIRELIQNTGYSAEVVSSKIYSAVTATDVQTDAITYKVKFSILGMTCASCVSAVTRAMDSVPETTMVSVDLIGKSGSVVVQQKDEAERVKSEIEDVGYECYIVEVSERKTEDVTHSTSRTVTIKVDGMFCG